MPRSERNTEEAGRTAPYTTESSARDPLTFYVSNPAMTSLVSYPHRCHLWGNAGYRGNCDGTLFKDLILRYGVRRVADPMMGSGTTWHVVDGLNNHRGLGIEYWGGDLREGFNLLRQDLPGTYDFVWIHPPYWNIVRYSSDRDDLSAVEDYTEFLRKLRLCLTRCYRALLPGGRLAVLVGDIRRSGTYTPLGRDTMNMAGSLGELVSVIIKAQHHCQSDAKTYGHMAEVPIKHEYCLIFQKR
jgi:hypothetical protein